MRQVDRKCMYVRRRRRRSERSLRHTWPLPLQLAMPKFFKGQRIE